MLITEEALKTLQDIRKFLDKTIHNTLNPTKVDWEKVAWIEVLDNMENNLKLAPNYFKYCSEEDKANGFFTAECDKCDWWGSSKYLLGGGANADTGDYDDCYCPVCGSVNYFEKEEPIEPTAAGTLMKLPEGDIINLGKQVMFAEGNQYRYCMDMRYFKGVPYGILFWPYEEYKNGLITFVADGYGITSDYKDKFGITGRYGSGSISVYGKDIPHLVEWCRANFLKKVAK